jgi:hypothetical protein
MSGRAGGLGGSLNVLEDFLNKDLSRRVERNKRTKQRK